MDSSPDSQEGFQTTKVWCLSCWANWERDSVKLSVYQHVDVSFAKPGETKMKQSHKSVDKLEPLHIEMSDWAF